MKIAFFAESCLPVHAQSLSERPLGGTETGLVRIAEILHAHGHDVTVFTSHKSPPPSLPRYLPAPAIHQSGEFDVLILVKDFQPISFKLPAKKVFYWTGDGPDQYVTYGMGDKRVADKLAGMFVVSDWQARALCEASGFPMQKTCYIGNGVHLPYFEGSEQRNRKRLMWASAPNRGLDLAYGIFTELQKQHSDLEFHIFAGFDLYDTDTKFAGPLVEQYKKLQQKISTNRGCVLHGNVSQQALAREYMKSAVLFYPNTIFETCCIVTLEAQAAGCPTVASNNSGLAESVRDGGVVINGKPGSPQYVSETLRVLNSLLIDDALWQRYSESCLWKATHELSWEHVVRRFESFIPC